MGIQKDIQVGRGYSGIEISRSGVVTFTTTNWGLHVSYTNSHVRFVPAVRLLECCLTCSKTDPGIEIWVESPCTALVLESVEY